MEVSDGLDGASAARRRRSLRPAPVEEDAVRRRRLLVGGALRSDERGALAGRLPLRVFPGGAPSLPAARLPQGLCLARGRCPGDGGHDRPGGQRLRHLVRRGRAPRPRVARGRDRFLGTPAVVGRGGQRAGGARCRLASRETHGPCPLATGSGPGLPVGREGDRGFGRALRTAVRVGRGGVRQAPGSRGACACGGADGFGGRRQPLHRASSGRGDRRSVDHGPLREPGLRVEDGGPLLPGGRGASRAAPRPPGGELASGRRASRPGLLGAPQRGGKLRGGEPLDHRGRGGGGDGGGLRGDARAVLRDQPQPRAGGDVGAPGRDDEAGVRPS